MAYVILETFAVGISTRSNTLDALISTEFITRVALFTLLTGNIESFAVGILLNAVSLAIKVISKRTFFAFASGSIDLIAIGNRRGRLAHDTGIEEDFVT